eukprot:8185009-Pyramimonas_sp.AAC.1
MPEMKDFLLPGELHLQPADRGFPALPWAYEMALSLGRPAHPRRVGRRGGLGEELREVAA